jgi:hypothetical protein
MHTFVFGTKVAASITWLCLSVTAGINEETRSNTFLVLLALPCFDGTDQDSATEQDAVGWDITGIC